VGDLQAWPWPQLLGVVGGQRKLAGRLWEWCWGRDAAPVADKGPPKSIQVSRPDGRACRREGRGSHRVKT
jgi:hypothetical protein